MKVLRLSASNVKRLKVVDITPDPFMQPITGKNGSGKTSTLDSLLWAIAGKSSIQAQPIRGGTEEATIRLDLGEIIVRRTIVRTEEGFRTSVLVLNPAGAEPGTPDKKLPRWSSPQEMLDAIMGELSFDPLGFSRMKPREQFEELRRIAKVPLDFDAINEENSADFKERARINKEAKAKRALAEAIVVDENIAPVDEAVLLDQIEAASLKNTDIEKRRSNRDRAQKEAARLRADAVRHRGGFDGVNKRADEHIADLQRQIREVEEVRAMDLTKLEESAIAATTAAEDLESRIATAGELPPLMSIAELRAQLDAAKTANASVAERNRRLLIEKEAETLETESAALTKRMEDRETQKRDAIKAAEMPVPGLGFGDSFITYGGVPFEQASSAEQLRVSVSIAMAANPKLRVIRIQDGSLLDDDGMALIAQMAHEKDYQVFIEKVDSSGKIGIYMEDGEVRVQS